jgi:hypothetical protein
MKKIIVLTWNMIRVGSCLDMVLFCLIGEPSNINLAELKVREAVVVSERSEDVWEVNAGKGPGNVSGDHPDNVLVPVELLTKTDSSGIENVLWSLVGWLMQHHALEEEEDGVDHAKPGAAMKKRVMLEHLAYMNPEER